uniref:Fe-S cluster assembly protein SufD n=1 Tax=uncultured Alphaproteobacteria bacterium TaxID=91750 RepID=A0A6G8F2K7_9PROT|nr:Fe-S cluster assembly protein SufD [uncultured Alphaproteobacteria bacterium]
MTGLLSEISLFGQDIPWLEGLRERGRSSFVLPTAKSEAWRYTKLHSLAEDDFIYAPSKFLEELEGTAESEECCCHGDCNCHHHDGECHCGNREGGCSCGHHNLDLFVDLPFDAYQLHFYNGKFVPLYPAFPAGVEVMTLMQAVVEGEARNYAGKYIDLKQYPFAALNSAFLEEGLFFVFERNLCLSKPIAIIYHTNTTQHLASHVRNVFVAENNASVEIVEYYLHVGADKDRYFNNIVNEFYLAPQADVKHCKFQDEAFKAVHIGLNYVRIKAGAKYKSFCLQKGADLGRNETKADLLQEGACAEINAAYIMNGWATLDTTTDVEHMAAKTMSSQLIKGVVGGEARGVFQGKIRIVKDAQETEGRQLHRALLLSDTAEIDVKPELEIFADNVKCSHGAACGELDADQLFYMRSRGIGEDEAKQILIDAYLQEVVNLIDNEEVREWIRSNV